MDEWTESVSKGTRACEKGRKGGNKRQSTRSTSRKEWRARDEERRLVLVKNGEEEKKQD